MHPDAPNPTLGGAAKLHPQKPHTYFRQQAGAVTRAGPEWVRGRPPGTRYPGSLSARAQVGEEVARDDLRSSLCGPVLRILNPALPRKTALLPALQKHPPSTRETLPGSPPKAHSAGSRATRRIVLGSSTLGPGLGSTHQPLGRAALPTPTWKTRAPLPPSPDAATLSPGVSVFLFGLLVPPPPQFTSLVPNLALSRAVLICAEDVG